MNSNVHVAKPGVAKTYRLFCIPGDNRGIVSNSGAERQTIVICRGTVDRLTEIPSGLMLVSESSDYSLSHWTIQ